ncbi:Hypothetical protein CAP_4747 [Chondromyces apiculatus DSM 436]|uniref:Uncharacterized protein n=1 Tax=Chondromyces apiculatus DSM 436 TaxID=1192034 RepID=A0A017T649_9BACT|nr:Hypothetical protein CAP_4747 [Chondromyces apiculatus DSM 436]
MMARRQKQHRTSKGQPEQATVRVAAARRFDGTSLAALQGR